MAYNEERHVRPLLESLRHQTFRDFEVVFIDNNSADATAKIVAGEFPEVRYNKMDSNLGFAEGNNEGYRRSSAPVVVLLNADTRVPPEWLDELMQPLLAAGSERLACTHSPILNEGPNYLTSTETFHPERATLGTTTLAGRNCDTGRPFHPWLVFYGSGAALAVRKSAAGEALFDKDYFIYAEDTALGWALRARGFYLMMCPRAIVHHGLPPQGRPSTPKALRAWERNRLFNLYIYYSTWTRYVLRPIFALDMIALALQPRGSRAPDGTTLPGLAASTTKGQMRELRKAVLEGMFDAIRANPQLRRKHKEAEAKRKVADRVVTAAMTARITASDDGKLGLINQLSLAWARAAGIVTVETAREEDLPAPTSVSSSKPAG